MAVSSRTSACKQGGNVLLGEENHFPLEVLKCAVVLDRRPIGCFNTSCHIVPKIRFADSHFCFDQLSQLAFVQKRQLGFIVASPP